MEAFGCRGLAVRFPDPAVEALAGVDLEQAEGELVAVLGATGAGKSTLLKCANRIVPELQHAEIRGEVRIFGRPIEGLRVAELADRVGFVFQDFEAQLFSTSVREEIVFGLEQLGVAPAKMEERSRAALDAVGLAGFERRDPTSLSGGEKQRLAIAAALALRPGLFVLDEPSTDLDPAGRRDILRVLDRLRTSGTALLMAEHDTEAVLGADRVVVLRRGVVAERGPAAEVLIRARELDLLGVRPPELASVCSGLGLPAWPLDLDSVEARMKAAGWRIEPASDVAEVRQGSGSVLIEAGDVTFRYGAARRDAVGSASLTIHEGEFVALVGSNGSGKSTLARLLNGLLEPTRGTVRWRGRPLRALAPRERAAAVGYVFQDPDEQIFAATIEEEVAFGPIQLGWDAAERERHVRDALEAVGIAEMVDRDPFLLGKGERQKVAVASILALAPQVLVLDEPTTGLDFHETRELMDLLAELNRRGKTIIVITHVPWIVTRYARRAVLMSEGSILFDGSVRELVAREELCRAGDFLPGPATRLGRRFGATPLTVEELLSWTRSG